MKSHSGRKGKRVKKSRKKSASSTVRVFCLVAALCFVSYIIFEVFGKKENGGAQKVAARNGGLRSSFSSVERQIDDDLITAQLREEEHEHDISSQHHKHSIGNTNEKNNRHTQKHQEFHRNKMLPVEQHAKKAVMDTNIKEKSREPSDPKPVGTTSPKNCNLIPSSRCVMENPAVVILSHNRVEYVTQTLRSLLKMPQIQKYKVYVSIDDPNSFEAIENAIKGIVQSSSESLDHFDVLTWRKSQSKTGHQWYSTALSKIAEHFKFVMEKGFMEMKHSHLIMVEDDLLLGYDFLQLFEETAWLIEAEPDKTYCVSAWNDNGLKAVVRQNEKGKSNLLRTGYFPGLGWTTTRKVWLDLRLRWPDKPTTGWDHWIRLSTSMNKRECIYPEIPRTKHVSTHGTNVNSADAVQKFQRYAFINDISPGTDRTKFIDTQKLLDANYNEGMKALVRHAHRVKHVSDVEYHHIDGNKDSDDDLSFLILYNREDYETLAPRVGLPRTQSRGWYRGIVQTFLRESSKYKGRRLFLAERHSADFIHDHEKLKPSANMQIIGAKRGEPCAAACKRNNLLCKDGDLEFVNSCESFQGVFGCENGCGHQVGAEIPCYVAKQSEPTFRQCLVSDSGRIGCLASHPATQRLCACS